MLDLPFWENGSGEGSDTTYVRTRIPIINKESTDTTISIDPNKFYIWGEVAELNISLNDPIDTTTYNEYMIQFTSGDTATELSLPENITWSYNYSEILANHTYQISIVNNMAVLSEF